MKKKILLVGASTGGPSQIKKLLSNIDSLSCTIIIAQHMREEVLSFFIKDLMDSLKFKVYATPMSTDFIEPSIIVCSGSASIEKKGSLYKIKSDTDGQMYTPDINKLFNSFVPFANDFDLRVLIMTGIGSDGVQGAKNLQCRGAKIYAQDEASSPVYGMPKAAYEAGILDAVKSFDEISNCFKGL